MQIEDRELPMVGDGAFRLQTEGRGRGQRVVGVFGYADTRGIRTGRVGKKRSELRNV